MLLPTLVKLGPGLTYGVLVTGQMIGAVVLEHAEALGVVPHRVGIARLGGVALLVAGVALIRSS